MGELHASHLRGELCKALCAVTAPQRPQGEGAVTGGAALAGLMGKAPLTPQGLHTCP